MKIDTKISTALLGFLACSQLASLARAGGIERFCVAPSGTQVTERWLNPNNVNWRVCGGPGQAPAPAPVGNYLAPGYPPSLATIVAQLPDNQRPMLQSLFRAIATWNNASISPAVPRVSNFSFATPTVANRVMAPYVPGLPAGEMGYAALSWWSRGLDSQNTITLWDGESSFVGMGGPQTLAITGVFAGASGAISEADIVLNARMGPALTGPRFWSFVEDNAALNVTLATRLDFAPSTPTFTDPVLGYADLEGVLVHELGHFAGLGHTLVDATNVLNASTFPTMFAEAQNETFAATVSTLTAAGWVTHVANPAVTAREGILGRSARTLEFDDLFAIADGYPLPAGNPYWTQTGTISGFVQSTAGVLTRGVAVTAVSATQPDTVRVGTLTYAGGVYRITGLPPGQYFLKIEQVDRGYAGAYFPLFDVPNYVQGVQQAGCVPLPPLFGAEWFDSTGINESPTETSNANATPVTVTAGVTTTANLRMNSFPNQLVVRNNTANVGSPRGIRAQVGQTVEFIVSGTSPGAPTLLGFDLQHTMIPLGTQMLEVNPVITFSAVADASGVARFSIPIQSTSARGNFIGQAGFLDPAGNLLLTNSVNMWIAEP